MEDQDERVSPANINYLAWTVANGTATPDDARRLLVEFVRQARTPGERVEPRLIEHLSDCIAAYLEGRKVLEPASSAGRDKPRGVAISSLDKAFGMVRATVGPQPVDGDTRAEVAALVLRELLRGESLESAAHSIGENRKAAGLKLTSDSQIRECWAKNKGDGWLTLRLMRSQGIEPGGWWTPVELVRLTEIYWDVPGFRRPGERFLEGRHAIPDLSSPDDLA